MSPFLVRAQKKLDRKVVTEQEEFKGKICDYVEAFYIRQSAGSYLADYLGKMNFRLRKRPDGVSEKSGTIQGG